MTTTHMRSRFLVLAATAAFAFAGAASAGPGNSSHSSGGAHAAAGGGHWGGGGGWHGGTWHGGGWHGGGWHGGGWHGGYYGGWRGGYGWYGWPYWGAGLFLATLPWYYETYWWGGVPYYYADNQYYTYDADAGGYRAVAPPGKGAAPGAAAAGQAPAITELYMYPKGGQSAEQQATDKYECHHWAAGQAQFDPTQPGDTPADQVPAKRAEYLRADAACLEGRNYSVR